MSITTRLLARGAAVSQPQTEPGTPAAFQQLRFFVEFTGARTSAPGARAEREVLALRGASSLLLDGGEVAIVAELRPNALGLEPLRIDDQSLLVMTIPEQGFNVKVNGITVGPTHALAVKDVLELSGGEHVLHLTAYNHPYVGLALAEHVGRECPICLSRIAEPARVVQCICGAVYHDGGSGVAGEESLECARTVTTCICNRALAREEGYTYEPC